MHPDNWRFSPLVKGRGQLAQLASASARLGLLACSAACLFCVALTFLVMGLPRHAVIALREVLR